MQAVNEGRVTNHSWETANYPSHSLEENNRRRARRVEGAKGVRERERRDEAGISSNGMDAISRKTQNEKPGKI